MNGNIPSRPFGMIDDLAVREYTLSNANGMLVSIINYGATITKIMTPDKEGVLGNVVLGFDDIDGYIRNGDQYIGCIVGRYCNRISNARFSISGLSYQLSANNNNNSLHGGIKGFDKQCWDVENTTDNKSLCLSLKSKDGDEGFPGNMHITVTYTLSAINELIIEYRAITDNPTPVNLTSHSYFNLSAGKSADILDHELSIFSDDFTPVDEGYIPTGQLASVFNSPLDFNISKNIRKEINKLPQGYDHNYVLKKYTDKAATLYDPTSGRFMEMFTTEPGLQFYSGNHLDKTILSEITLNKHAALCLEAQHYPDSPNKAAFPNTILYPGEEYIQKTIYRFSVK